MQNFHLISLTKRCTIRNRPANDLLIRAGNAINPSPFDQQINSYNYGESSEPISVPRKKLIMLE